VALTLTTGTGTLGGTTSMNAVAGVADFTGKGLNINLVGADKVLTATATVAAGTMTTTTSPAFGITPGAASQLAVTGFPASATAGSAGNITVTAKDTFGNTAASYAGTITFSVGVTDAGKTLPANYTFTTGTGNDNGVHTFSSGVTLTKAVASGGQSITATDTGTGSITGTEGGITVNAGALDHFVISTISSPQTSGTAIAGITITAQDANNNTCDTGANAFTGTVTYGGTAGITGTSSSFLEGVLSGVSVTPLTAGIGKTFTVAASGKTGSATIDVNPVITASAGVNGSISPSGATVVTYNANQTFAIAPNANYAISDVVVDSTTHLGALTSYTFNNVTANHTISATFTIDTFTLTPSVVGGVGGHGTISPATPQTVAWGTSQTFTFSPALGYNVRRVLVDGSPVAYAGNRYTFTNVTADHTISVEFALGTFTISASAGPHGSIAPAGNVRLALGGAQSYVITPEPGYHVADVRVDGRSVGAVTSYAFTNVTASHTISAGFAADTYAISALVGTAGHGRVTPAGTQTVAWGATPTYTFTPERGYYASRLTLDGVVIAFSGPNRYTFAPVTGSHVLQVFFTVAPRQALR